MGVVTDSAGDAPDLADLLADADQALVRTVDGLDDAAYAEPSLLPDWTRGHVVAHLALNAEGLAGVLHGAHVGRVAADVRLARGAATPTSPSCAAAPRRAARAAPRRERRCSPRRSARCTRPTGRAASSARRADPTWRCVNVPLMRVREVEIHHADLDSGYAAADWPADFRVVLLESMTKRPYPAPFSVRPTDLDRTWRYGDGEKDGDGGPAVSGTSAALGWWLTGRGTGEGLESDNGDLPEVESW